MGSGGVRRVPGPVPAQIMHEFGQIADEQAALRRVAVLVAKGTSPDEVFAAVAEETGRLLAADFAILCRYGPRSLEIAGTWTKTGGPPPTAVGVHLPLGGRNVSTLVHQTGRPERIDYHSVSGEIGQVADHEWGLRTSVGIPVSVEGQLWGVVVVAFTHVELLQADTETRLAGFTELLATAIANAQARGELRRSAEEQAALHRVATLVARSAPAAEVFAAVTAEAGQLLGADVSGMCRYDSGGTITVVDIWASTAADMRVSHGSQFALGGHNTATLVYQTGQPQRIDDLGEATGTTADPARELLGARAVVSVPLRAEGRLWGIVSVMSGRAPLPADTEARLARFTELAATAIANAEAKAEAAASRARILAAADETRRRIERDLHDGVQQRLVILALKLSSIRDTVPTDVRADVDEASRELAATRQELRGLCQGVHPAILTEAGLGAAVRALARRSPLPVRIHMQAIGRLPASCEVTAYYVAVEAFTNAAKHANASAVDIIIEQSDGMLTVQVRDDGMGGADPTGGSGLTGLRDRVEAVSGSMTLDSAAGAGTVLTVRLPATADDQGSIPG
jgi:signal transduction histidine kinase